MEERRKKERRNVAAKVAEGLKTVTYAAPSYGGTQKKKTNKTRNNLKIIHRTNGSHVTDWPTEEEVERWAPLQT